MKRLTPDFKDRTLPSEVRRWVSVTLLCVLSGCGAQTQEPDVDGQSHWWKLCAGDDDCYEGFQCACGACTRQCTAVDACGSTPRVQCSLRAGFCEDDFALAEVNVCQVACTEASECPDKLTCHAGLCVNAQVAAQESNTSVEPELDAGSVPLCGDPPRECPPPPVDWCTARGNTPFPEELVTYWSSFCDASADASGVIAALCGDGIIQADEACDDGNTTSGDGCTATCDSVELNYDCMTPGQPCQPE